MATFADALTTQPDISQAPFMEREVRDILRTKAGQTAEGLPAVPSAMEALALGQTRAQEAQQLAEFNLREQAIEQAEKEARQRENFERKKLTQQAINIKQNFNNKSSQLLQKFSQDQDALKFQKKAASAEQLGFFIRLNNDKYVDKLKAEGARLRLSNELNFKEQATLAAFSEELNMFKTNLAFRKAMAEDDRKFKAEMAIVDLDAALELALGKTYTDMERMKWEAAGQMVKGGIMAAGVFSGRGAPEQSYTSGASSGIMGNRLME